MLDIVWNFTKIGDDSDKHHGVIGLFLEFIVREIR